MEVEPSRHKMNLAVGDNLVKIWERRTVYGGHNLIKYRENQKNQLNINISVIMLQLAKILMRNVPLQNHEITQVHKHIISETVY